MTGLQFEVDHIYDELVAPGDYDRLVETGEVPVIRNGKRGYELLEKLTLRDLPAVLDTFVVLEEEEKQKREKDERKRAERKERERIRAKSGAS